MATRRQRAQALIDSINTRLAARLPPHHRVRLEERAALLATIANNDASKDDLLEALESAEAKR